jgi:Tfp pilus assembly protein PilF/DNA-binding CsgD family transcriptional regulator
MNEHTHVTQSVVKQLVTALIIGFTSFPVFAQKQTLSSVKLQLNQGIAVSYNPSSFCKEFQKNNLDRKQFASKEEWFKALAYLEKQARIHRGNDYLETLICIAKRLHNHNEYQEGYYYIFKANNEFNELSHSKPELIKTLYEQTALSYFYFQRYDEAEKAMRKAIDSKALRTRDSIGFYNTMGLIYREKGQNEVSKHYFSQALMIAERTRNKPWIAVLSGNLGYYYWKQQKPSLARKLADVDFKFSIETKQYGSAINALSLIIRIDTDQGQIEEAGKKILVLEELLKKEPSITNSREYYRCKTHFLEATNNYKNALESYRNMTLYEDSIEHQKDVENIKKTEFRINFEQQQGKLLQEKKKRSDYFLYGILIISSLTIATFIIVLYQILHRRKREREITVREKELLEEKRNQTEREMRKALSHLMEKNELIELLHSEINQFQKLQHNTHTSEKLDIKTKLQGFTLLTDDDWLEFKRLFEKLNPGFFEKITLHFPDLTNAEIRLITLIKLNLSNLEMSRALGISPDSVRKTSLRLRKKLEMDQHEELVKFILTL